MMQMRTSTIKQSSSAAFVFWRTGLEKFGVLHVSFDVENDEIDIAAELIAIHHLLFEKKIFNRIPSSGSPYALTVSRGAIKKLALDKSEKLFPKRYAKFLSGNGVMKGASIRVQPAENFNVVDFQDIETIKIEHERFHFVDEIETPNFGSVVITSHAIERFAQRTENPDVKNPRVSLIKCLCNPSLKRLDMGEAVLKHKKMKYGADNMSEVWGHESAVVKFLVIKDKITGKNVLATVFSRSEKYW